MARCPYRNLFQECVVDDLAINVPTLVVTEILAVDKEIILLPASIEFVISRDDQEPRSMIASRRP